MINTYISIRTYMTESFFDIHGSSWALRSWTLVIREALKIPFFPNEWPIHYGKKVFQMWKIDICTYIYIYCYDNWVQMCPSWDPWQLNWGSNLKSSIGFLWISDSLLAAFSRSFCRKNTWALGSDSSAITGTRKYQKKMDRNLHLWLLHTPAPESYKSVLHIT